MPVQLTNPWIAVKPIGDRLGQARALQRIHEAFHAGREVAGGLRGVVAQSWARSGKAGIDPINHLAPIVMDEREVSDRWSHHLLFPVLPVLRDLLSGATNDSGHMLVISDARGVVMWIEGHRQVITATEDMHFVCGADWSEGGAGTNALGTAIAVDHPVQIFSAEHFNRAVHPWQCSGAPIHDPETGEILGVLDLTGHLRTAHPHTLGLVTAAAGMAEAYLRHELERRDEHLREAYFGRIAGAAQPTALVRPTGRVLAAVPHGWLAPDVGAPISGQELRLPDGTLADVEALPRAGDEGMVLWRRRPGAAPRQLPATVRLELFGRAPRLHRAGGAVELTPRHAEILATLLLAGRGLTVEELTHEVYGDSGKAVTLRAEMSRLRRKLDGLLTARPYAFALPVSSDLERAEILLAEGRHGEAVEIAEPRLLPGSHVPRIVAARQRLESALGRCEPIAARPAP
ncbi:MAG TPA: GAF domain-containing protein [Solirubrobacteraceae bacterium]|nr:GAF domain-containing protein [Solirubrobacteraceae bacterium]